MDIIPDIVAQKRQLRSEMRQRRAELNEAVHERMSQDVCQNLYELCISLSSIFKKKTPVAVAAFLPMNSETDISIFLEKAKTNWKLELQLPQWDDGKMWFSSDSGLLPQIYIVPGLCFDRRGSRLGYGKGFYDRYFTSLSELQSIEKKARAIKVGVCFSTQVQEYLPTEPHDVRMDYLVTDTQVLSFT